MPLPLLRSQKGSELTHEELDANIVYLDKKVVLSNVAPTVTDDISKDYTANNVLWLNKTNGVFYEITDDTIDSAVWNIVPTGFVKNFTDLEDTPSSYIANRFLKTTPDGLGVGFIDVTIIENFLGLSDTPSTFSANKWLKVNSAGDALEYGDAPTASTTFTALTDTPSIYSANMWLKVNSAGDALEFVSDPTIPATTFEGLTDVPTMSGNGGRMLVVNSSGNALEYIDSPIVNYDQFTSLTDTPADYTDSEGKVLRVNSTGDALEFVTTPTGEVGLQEVIKDGNTGYRKASAIASSDGDIGEGAVDLSNSPKGAIGDYSFATGLNNEAQKYCAVFGTNNKADSQGAVIGGSTNTVTGTNGVAYGYKNRVQGSNAMAIGTGLNALLPNSFIFGKYNEAQPDTFLEIGNGSDDANRRNMLNVFNTGVISLPYATVANIDDKGIKSLVTMEWFNEKSTFLNLSDTPESFVAGKMLKVNAFGDSLEFVDLVAGTDFITLADTPSDYTNQAGKKLVVKSDETGVEFVDDASGGGSSDFLSLTDTPSDYTGNSYKILRVKGDGSGLEFAYDQVGANSLDQLYDTPYDYSGQAGRMLVLNDAEDTFEFADVPSGGGETAPVVVGGGGDLSLLNNIQATDNSFYDGYFSTYNDNLFIYESDFNDRGIIRVYDMSDNLLFSINSTYGETQVEDYRELGLKGIGTDGTNIVATASSYNGNTSDYLCGYNIDGTPIWTIMMDDALYTEYGHFKVKNGLAFIHDSDNDNITAYDAKNGSVKHSFDTDWCDCFDVSDNEIVILSGGNLYIQTHSGTSLITIDLGNDAHYGFDGGSFVCMSNSHVCFLATEDDGYDNYYYVRIYEIASGTLVIDKPVSNDNGEITGLAINSNAFFINQYFMGSGDITSYSISDGSQIAQDTVSNIDSYFSITNNTLLGRDSDNNSNIYYMKGGSPRPTGSPVGTMAYNKTSGKPIWHDGNEVWHYADGTVA